MPRFAPNANTLPENVSDALLAMLTNKILPAVQPVTGTVKVCWYKGKVPVNVADVVTGVPAVYVKLVVSVPWPAHAEDGMNVKLPPVDPSSRSISTVGLAPLQVEGNRDTITPLIPVPAMNCTSPTKLAPPLVVKLALNVNGKIFQVELTPLGHVGPQTDAG